VRLRAPRGANFIEEQTVKLRHGHAPGHIRDTARAAFDAWLEWDGTSPEPTVEYEERQISISRALGLVWNCTDIISGSVFDSLREAAGDRIGRRTYAACARFVRKSMTLRSDNATGA
jgi:hypothetical protein